MNELDSTWQDLLEAAKRRALVSGRTDVVEYLQLKASNDLLRTTASDWLIASFVQAAFEAERTWPAIKAEREEPFEFMRGSGRMRGSRLIISSGVRRLELHVGWPRTPSDGIVRGNALAAADVIHFGLSRYDRRLSLVRGDATPQWFDDRREPADTAFIYRQIGILRGECD